MDTVISVISKVEVEFNLYWIEENPALFRERYQAFLKEHAAKYDIACIPSNGYMKLVATLKQNEGSDHGSTH